MVLQSWIKKKKKKSPKKFIFLQYVGSVSLGVPKTRVKRKGNQESYRNTRTFKIPLLSTPTMELSLFC